MVLLRCRWPRSVQRNWRFGFGRLARLTLTAAVASARRSGGHWMKTRSANFVSLQWMQNSDLESHSEVTSWCAKRICFGCFMYILKIKQSIPTFEYDPGYLLPFTGWLPHVTTKQTGWRSAGASLWRPKFHNGQWQAERMRCGSVVSTSKDGGFLKWGYPNSWMIYKGKSY